MVSHQSGLGLTGCMYRPGHRGRMDSRDATPAYIRIPGTKYVYVLGFRPIEEVAAVLCFTSQPTNTAVRCERESAS